MYVVIRRTKLGGPPEEAAQRTRDHVVPLIEGRPGFRGYCAFITEQRDAAYSVSVFDDRDTALDAHQRVRQWIEANMRDLMPDEPRITAGKAVFHEVAQPREEQAKDRRQPLFAVIRSYGGITGQTETMHSAASEHARRRVGAARSREGSLAMARKATEIGPEPREALRR